MNSYAHAMLLLLISLTSFSPLLCWAQQQEGLQIAIYHKGELPSQLPNVFPQHRPYKLLLHAHERIRTHTALLQLANMLAAPEKLAGLQYYSQSEKKMKTFFKESAAIAHPRAHAQVKIPAFHRLPLDTTFYIRQEDNRIGPVVYRAALQADSMQVSLFLYNVFPVSKFGLQLVESGDFLLYIAAQQTQVGEIKLEAWQWLRFKDGILNLFVKEASLVNRLKAVVEFYKQACTKE
ncbi:hypothetical protein HUU05_12950 [candidate division KSB1 bacterium]|nr:hypothetical protein [candidate division KSB1 bacterium]